MQEFTKADYIAACAKKYMVVDIETIPNPDMVKLLPEPSIDSRLKDPAKVAEARINAKQTQLEKMALSPLTGKVACIGYANEETRNASVVNEETSEKDLLDQFYNTITQQGYIPITYNGKLFDLPFIFKRGIMLGCEWATIPVMKVFTDRYKSADTHIDVMAEFCNYGEYEKLDNLARFILGQGKVEFDVTRIADLIQTEAGANTVMEYCLSDCDITWKLAKKMGFINQPKGEENATTKTN